MKMKLQYLMIGVLLLLASCEEPVPTTRASFQITIENISSGETTTPLSSGVYLLKKEGFPLFITGQADFGTGLSNIAGDGVIEPLLTNLGNDTNVLEAGSFGVIGAGESTTIEFEASYGTFFNFATMFVESNDLFYSFDEDGIHLFEPNGDPISGDVSRMTWLWEGGTEVNQEPYTGSFQPLRQDHVGQGEVENIPIDLVNDGYSYPSKLSVIRITITSTIL